MNLCLKIKISDLILYVCLDKNLTFLKDFNCLFIFYRMRETSRLQQTCTRDDYIHLRAKYHTRINFVETDADLHPIFRFTRRMIFSQDYWVIALKIAIYHRHLPSYCEDSQQLFRYAGEIMSAIVCRMIFFTFPTSRTDLLLITC